MDSKEQKLQDASNLEIGITNEHMMIYEKENDSPLAQLDKIVLDKFASIDYLYGFSGFKIDACYQVDAKDKPFLPFTHVMYISNNSGTKSIVLINKDEGLLENRFVARFTFTEEYGDSRLLNEYYPIVNSGFENYENRVCIGGDILINSKFSKNKLYPLLLNLIDTYPVYCHLKDKNVNPNMFFAFIQDPDDKPTTPGNPSMSDQLRILGHTIYEAPNGIYPEKKPGYYYNPIEYQYPMP